MREIARLLKRSPSTISREIKRHTCTSLSPQCYYPQIAEHNHRMMKRRRGQRKRLKNDHTRLFVETKLKTGWSPEIIAGRLHAIKSNTTVSHEAIYQYIYKERKDLIKHLPRKHTKRKRKFPLRKSRNKPIAEKVSIDKRPEDINNRSTYGHWESDSIVDKHHSLINVIVERKTRMVHITKLNSPTSAATADAIISRLSCYEQCFSNSITYDNGPENAKHSIVNQTLGCSSFFCAPYHSWEKGLVENTNEKIRRYIPKKTEFVNVTQEQLDAIEASLNDRPRKCLGYHTPNEAYQQWRASVIITDQGSPAPVALTG